MPKPRIREVQVSRADDHAERQHIMCRRSGCWHVGRWNVRFIYENRYNYVSLYWCDEHLPVKHRPVGESPSRER
jgi:hypothetical protein